MNKIDPLSPPHIFDADTRTPSRNTIALAGDLLPLCDFTSVLISAYLGALAYFNWISVGVEASSIWSDGVRAAVAAAVLAPFILCDRAFTSFANKVQTAALIRCYIIRFPMFIGVVAAIGFSSHSLASLPHAWLILWLISCLLVTAITRLLLVASLRRLERKGALAETIVVVGAGPAADRLISHLQQMRPNSIKILGVFDDRSSRRTTAAHQPTGTIEDLLEMGKISSIDWILLALPFSAEARVEAIVHRLKPLAVPIGLCPLNAGFAMPGRPVHFVGDKLSVIRLADRRCSSWGAVVAAIEIVLPHWIPILLGLPVLVLKSVSISLRSSASISKATVPKNLVCTLDNYNLEDFTNIAKNFGSTRYGYVVTPNADHLIRLHREPSFRELYANAAYILLDSQFISHLLRFTKKLKLRVCTGSDLTAKLFRNVIKANDQLVLIGGTHVQATCLTKLYGVKNLAHFNPPMGFIHDPVAVEECLQFIESHSPFRFCLLAIGAPQQEIIAQYLKSRGVALGMALCIGASINFLTGDEQRAPLWMQRSGMEWMFRLVQAPRRMTERYLVRGPKLFGLLRHTDIVLRDNVKPLPSLALSTLLPQQKAGINAELVLPENATARRPERLSNKRTAKSR